MKIQKGVDEKSKMFFYFGNKKNSLFFYPLSAGHFYCDGDYCIERKTYDSILIALVVNGKLSFVVDGREQTANADEIAIIDCFKPHRYYANDTLETYWIHINGSNTYMLYNEMVSRFGNVVSCHPNTEMQIKNLYTLLKNKIQISDVNMSKEIYLLLTEIFSSANSINSNAVENAVKYISDNFNRKLTVAEIAKEVHLSPSQFSRNFKCKIGIPPYEYLQNLRLTKAKELLKNTSLSISEIAYQTGFQSDSNFIFFFKNQEGISPLKFRNVLF